MLADPCLTGTLFGELRGATPTQRKAAMSDKVLWTVPEAAEQLSISVRTIQRLIDRRILPTTRIMGCVRLPVLGTLEAVKAMTSIATIEDKNTAEITGDSSCHTGARVHQSGMSVTRTRAAAELDALLARRATGKPKTSKRSGVSRLTGRKNGANNRNGNMTS